MFCTKCGNQLPDDSAFCHKCGAKTIPGESVPEQPGELHPSPPVNPSDSPASVETPTIGVIQPPVGSEGQLFREFVDKHVQATTKFRSAEDILTHCRPMGFIWICIGVPAILGLIIAGPTGFLLFGALLGYAAIFVASMIIRARYSTRFSGKFAGDISLDELLQFLNGHLNYLPQLHEWGCMDQGGGVLATIGVLAADALKEVTICCEYGPKKRNLVTITIRPDPLNPDSGQMQYFSGAARNGVMLDGRASGLFSHSCLIRTAPVLQAAMEYYLKSHNLR